ncbi:MAG: DUF4351 domain-containing protein [Magnetococcus sp. XQGC-1]
MPEQLSTAPFRHAFAMAMLANMTHEELAMYDKAGIAIADARGAVEQAREEALREGRQEGRQEGEQKGRQDGIQIGEQKGRREEGASMLTRLLQRRFGDLPPWASQEIADAELSTLEEWSLWILDAPTLESVLAVPS